MLYKVKSRFYDIINDPKILKFFIKPDFEVRFFFFFLTCRGIESLSPYRQFSTMKFSFRIGKI